MVICTKPQHRKKEESESLSGVAPTRSLRLPFLTDASFFEFFSFSFFFLDGVGSLMTVDFFCFDLDSFFFG